MHHTRIFATLSTILFLLGTLPPGVALAEPSEELAQSTVTLSDISGKSCATGFVLEDGSIATNSHILKSICPLGSCESIVIKSSRGVGHKASIIHEFSSIEVLRDDPALDFALIKPEYTSPFSGSFSLNPSPSYEGQVELLGYPDCKTLTHQTGKVLSQNILHIYTDLHGRHGISGSPIFLSGGSVVGVSDEASSLLSALSAIFLGGSFELRAIKSSAIQQASSIPQGHIQLIESYYADAVLTKRNKERVRASIDFIALVRGFKKLLRFEGFSSSYLSFINEYPGSELSELNPPGTETEEALERIAVAHNLENSGLFRAFGTSLKIADGFAFLVSTSGRSPDQTKAIIQMYTEFKNSGYIGLRPTQLYWALVTTLGLGLLLSMWASSLGYVFRDARGSIAKRFLKMLGVALLLWPISLIAYFFMAKRSQDPE